MTFSSWYAANVTPQLEESLKSVPLLAREAVRTASRRAMAACWNAALEAIDVEPHSPTDTVAIFQADIEERVAELRA